MKTTIILLSIIALLSTGCLTENKIDDELIVYKVEQCEAPYQSMAYVYAKGAIFKNPIYLMEGLNDYKVGDKITLNSVNLVAAKQQIIDSMERCKIIIPLKTYTYLSEHQDKEVIIKKDGYQYMLSCVGRL